MRFLSSDHHRLLDFVTVAAFAAAPFALKLAGVAAIVAYVLAAVHLGLTLITHFPSGAPRPIPFGVHGMVEGVVGVALIVLPFAVGWTGTPRIFYLAAGVVILAVYALSQYGPGPAPGGSPS